MNDEHFHYATDSEIDYAAAQQIGAENPDRPWVFTDRDVWHRNPYYTGPEVRHPEDDSHLYAEENRSLPPITPTPDDDLPF